MTKLNVQFMMTSEADDEIILQEESTERVEEI